MKLSFSLCLAVLLCGMIASAFAKDAPKFKAVTTARDSVHWEDYTAALSSAKKDQKMIFVDIVADWCIPCREMEKTTYRDKQVVETLNKRFHPVRLNQAAEDTIQCDDKRLPVNRCFFNVWNLQAVPSYVLIAPKGLSILTYSGKLSSDELRMLLMQFLEKEKEWISQ